MPHTLDGSVPPPLIVRCEDCLKGRWCERCHKWWDESCYTGSTTAQRTEIQQIELGESIGPDGKILLLPEQKIKVYNGLCVEHCLPEEEMAGAGAGAGGMWG